MPIYFSIKEQYFTFLVLLNSLFVLLLFSPFFLNMLSFSSEDVRSLALFPIRFNELVVTRNVLNFVLLIIAFGLSIILMGLSYPKTNFSISETIVLSVMHLLPAISIGNLTSRLSLSWMGKTTFSWKGGYLLLLLNFNIMMFKIFQYYLVQPVFILVIVIVLLFYLGFYYLSFRKIVKELSMYFCSIAENEHEKPHFKNSFLVKNL